MDKAIVNARSYEITTRDDTLMVDGQSLNWNLVKLAEGHFHILYQNKSYRAEVVKVEIASKTFALKINGRSYTVTLKDKFDQLLEKMGMTNHAAGKLNTLKAPMPGLIIDLKVAVGDRVKTGDPLVVLEAMKMENVIKSLGEATVKSVNVSKGDSVEKGQALIEF